MRNIVIPLYDQVLLLDVSGPAEVFSLANRFIVADKKYRIITVATAPNAVIVTSNGIRLLADQTFADALDTPHIILVPGGPGAYNNPQPELYLWLQRHVAAAQWYGSVCTGAFILGRAGLLHGKEVTTHWNYTKRLAAEFPDVRVAHDKILTRDGQLMTSGGITTAIDLALSLVERDHGRAVAVSVAKTMLLNTSRLGGQLQFNPAVPDLNSEAAGLSPLLPYILQHLTQKITVADLAEVVQLSVRQLTRRLSHDIQMSPMEFVQAVRLDQARMLLETSELPLKTIAYQCGFGCVRQMTDLFKKRLGITPIQYRQQFS